MHELQNMPNRRPRGGPVRRRRRVKVAMALQAVESAVESSATDHQVAKVGAVVELRRPSRASTVPVDDSGIVGPKSGIHIARPHAVGSGSNARVW